MSNFDFLQEEWPLAAKLAQSAENNIYDDPNSCLIKLGMLAEWIVSCIVEVNGIVMPADEPAAELLKRILENKIASQK